MNINITFGSDAHAVDQVGFKYEEVSLLAKELGFTKCMTFSNRDSKLVSF